MLGCAKSVEVTTDFPVPLLEPIQLTAGIRYPEDLTDFVHTEDPELEPEWEIRLGQANLLMFRRLFGAMFTETIELAPDPAMPIPDNIDFIIEPKLEDLEFSVPRQSATDQYVVWLKYKLTILLPDGQLISNWRITAYGQEDEGDLGMGSENAMRDAAIKALRDASANIAISFAGAPGVEEYLLGNAQNTISPAIQAVEDTTLESEQPEEDTLEGEADNATAPE
jgi:hypothetical protein